MNLRDRQILHIALPSIVSNITVPLLGLVDVAIVGHMGSAVYIGAVAVGSMIFNLVYWLFAFLRMGSSGLTAQAWGRRDMSETVRILVRAVLIALLIALLLLVLQVPLCRLMFWLIEPTPDVLPLASTYFYMVIWGAPASLCLFVLTGWFIGMQNTRFPMLVSILQNVVNIFVSLSLVYGLGMKIEGVALGTVIAQYAGLLVAAGLLWRYYGRIIGKQKQFSTLPFFNSSILQSFHSSIQNISGPLPAYALPGGCQPVFYRCGCSSGSGCFVGEYGAAADVSLLFLLHGWIRVCRGSPGRQNVWGTKHAGFPRDITAFVVVDGDGDGCLYLIIYNRWHAGGGGADR